MGRTATFEQRTRFKDVDVGVVLLLSAATMAVGRIRLSRTFDEVLWIYTLKLAEGRDGCGGKTVLVVTLAI